MAENERQYWIDSLKGFGILLIVISHAYLPQAMYKYLFSFHVPLFFFISGYLFNLSKSRMASSARYINNRVRRLLKPYLVFSVFGYFVYVLIKLLHAGIDTKTSALNYQTLVILPYKGLILAQPVALNQINGPLWFLGCLFIVDILFYFLHKLARGNPIAIVLALFTSAVVGQWMSIHNIVLPLNINSAWVCLDFYGAGYFVCRYGLIEKMTAGKYTSKYLGLIIYCLLVISGLAELSNGWLAVQYNQYSNIRLFFLSAFSMIAVLALIFFRLPRSPILEYFGNITIDIMCIHKVLFSVFDRLFTTGMLLLEHKYIVPSHYPLITPLAYTLLALFMIMGYERWVKPHFHLLQM